MTATMRVETGVAGLKQDKAYLRASGRFPGLGSTKSRQSGRLRGIKGATTRWNGACASLMLGLLATLGLLTCAPSAHAQGKSGKVSGSFEGNLIFGVPLRSEGTITGDLAGTFTAVYFNFETRPDGTITAVGLHTFVTADGYIFTKDEIILHPTDDPAVVTSTSHLHIIGGTGQYDQATGLIKIVSGIGSFATGVLSLGFEGEVHLKQ
jgi:hypothetical protein